MSSPRLSINYPLEIISSIDNLALGTHGNGGKRCLLVNAAGPPVVLLATRAKLERKEVVLGALSSSAPRTLPLHQPELVSETPEIRGGTRVLRPEPGTQEEEEENEEEEEENGMEEEEGKVVEMEKEEEEEGGAPRVRSYRLLHGSLPTAPPPPRPTCSTVIIIIIIIIIIIFVICVIDVNC